MANLGGMNLPSCYNSWIGGGGSNPGTLGSVIRSRTLQTGETKNEIGGNGPKTNKGC